MSVTWTWLGNISTTGAGVTAKVTAGTNARLKVATNSGLTTGVQFGSSVAVGANLYVKMLTPTLTAGTSYYYGVEVDGTVDATKIYPFKTAPAGAASFSVGCASCNDSGVTSVAWARSLARNPDIWIHLGDNGYPDITTNNQASFRTNYNGQMTKADSQAAVFAQIPTSYTWSDHDFGANNAVGTVASKPAAQAVYREVAQHHTLPSSTDIYHTFVYGRVRFIITDMRSNKSLQTDTDNSSKTVLGATQKQWFKDTLAAATEPVIFWVGDIPWTDAASADDEFANYNTERTELANFISTGGYPVIYLHGDTHSIGAHDGVTGTASPGKIPVFCASPLANSFSNKGTYTSGPYPTSGTGNIFQYGHITITDTGGSSVAVGFRGYDSSDTQRVSLDLTFAAVPEDPAGPPGSWNLAFQDEFTGTTLDTTKWTKSWGGGTMNGVTPIDGNISVTNGNLVLTLSSSTQGALVHSDYTSGRYQLAVGDYAEARIYFPGDATDKVYNWPAWWTSGPNWPTAGEFDIFEGLDGDASIVYHYGPSINNDLGGTPFTVTGTWYNAFHTYGVHRKAATTDIYWDGVLKKTWTNTDNGGAQELILNVGANAVLHTGTASQVKVDWVRAWTPATSPPASTWHYSQELVIR